MTAPWPLGEARLTIADVTRLAAPEGRVALGDAALARVAAGARVVAEHAATDRPVYGLNTGLGGNLGTRIPREEVAAFQAQIIRGRTIGLGPPLPERACRAALLLRVAEFATGHSGVTVECATTLAEMFNRGVTPVLPSFGSIGASDLGILGHLGAVAVGGGEAWHGGRRMPGAGALAAAGLQPLRPGPKDGLALISHTAVTGAVGALALHRLRGLLDAWMAVIALSLQGYAANPAILDPRLAALRPAAGQAEAASRLRDLLAGGAGASRSIQDALCFRLAAPVMGSAFTALDRAAAEIETEINGVTVTPAVLWAEGEILSSPNFHAPALTVALDALSIALAHAASAAALRLCKLMTARFSGLPAYLSPVGGGSAGYVSLQKTAADLLAEIRLGATASGTDVLAVSDTAEDIAPLTLHALRKLERQVAPLRYLIAIEALTAAQAVDLRGARATPLHALIRARVPPLTEDRASAPDVEALAALLDDLAEGRVPLR